MRKWEVAGSVVRREFVPRDLSTKEAEQIDRDNPNREKVTGEELDAVIRIGCGVVLTEEAARNDLGRVLDRLKAQRVRWMILGGCGLIKKGLHIIYQHTSMRQLKTMDANTYRAGLRLTAAHETDNTPDFTAVETTGLRALVQAVIADHCLLCSKSRKDQKLCEIRHAIENAPGLPDARMTADGCPMLIMDAGRMEVE